MKLNMAVSFFLFLRLNKSESKKQGIPKKLLPFQSGVGNVANAVLACIGNRLSLCEIKYVEII